MLNLLSKNNISLLRVINAVFILIVAIGTLLKYFSLKEIAEISNIVAILFFIFIASLMVMAFLIPFISKPLCKFFYIAEVMLIVLSQFTLFYIIHRLVGNMG